MHVMVKAKPKLAIPCRSMPLDYVCTNQYSLATSFIGDPQQSLASIATTIHTVPMMVQGEEM